MKSPSLPSLRWLQCSASRHYPRSISGAVQIDTQVLIAAAGWLAPSGTAPHIMSFSLFSRSLLERPMPTPFPRASFFALLCLTAAPVVSIAAQSTAPPTPKREVADTYFGTVIRDSYRWMEAPVGKNPEFMEYLKQQNTHTRAVLDQLPERPALLARLTELADIMPQVPSLSPAEDRWFYLRIDRGEQISKLYLHDLSSGSDRMLLDPDTLPSPKEEHWAIDYISPAPDGRLVGYGASLGGSEKTSLYLMDPEKARLLPDSISRVQFG